MSAVEDELRRAFDADEFFPVFQPLVELRTGQLAGFEALARWRHAKLGEILPDEFIPLVERSGLIDDLTQVVLEKAFASSALADSSLTLAVNFSPLQLQGTKTPDRIAGAARRGGFSLDRLTIEVTESALVDDLSRVQAVAQDLKSLRCKLALDDFGTGYSSLKHLHALPFDELKVDRSFVGSMTENRESRKIVASVVGLGQSLGMTTVAEGVERKEQADMLFWMGCDAGQGWFYGRPIPAQELPRQIEAARHADPIALPSQVDGVPVMSLESMPIHRLAQLQAIYDGVPVGLCFLDRNLRYVNLNRQLAQMNGVPAAAHIGKFVGEIIPHLFPRLEVFMRRALQGERVTGIEIEKPAPHEDGAAETVLISYLPVRDEAGEVLGISVAVMDATDRKRAEEALRESEAHYRSMVELSPHIPWVLDQNGSVIDASPRWETLTGQSMKEALGSGWLQMLHPDDLAHTREAVEASLKTGCPIDIEYRVLRRGGHWCWMRSRGSPRFGSSGEVIRVYGSVEDIDELKRAQRTAPDGGSGGGTTRV